MAERSYTYVIVGGGLAGASAVEGIRELDANGSAILIGNERQLPYDRPPLTKKLWFGKKKISDIVLHDASFYERSGVGVELGTTVLRIDRSRHSVYDDRGNEINYTKLLLATGGLPRRLAIPGGDTEGIYYFRTADDFRSLHARAQPGVSALVIGGGFIGSEIAAALRTNQVDVTLLFPEEYLCSRVFPQALGRSVLSLYRDHGVQLVAQDRPATIAPTAGRFTTRTAADRELTSDLVVVGIGIAPAVELAEAAGLALAGGITVNEQLQTSDPDIYAAGDNATFPYLTLGKVTRVEHWDNARAQGKQAGRNMAGAAEPYDYMPYFFSDLFDLGYEAVGEVDARLVTEARWDREFEKGTIYYTRDGRLRGVMLCNVWDKVDEARALIRSATTRRPEAVRPSPPQPNP